MKVKIKNARFAFLELFEAKEYQVGDGKPRYSATLLIEKGSPDDKAIRTAIATVGKEAWADKAEKVLKSFEGNSQKYCYLDGDSKDYDGFAGMMYVAAHRRAKDGPPGVYSNTAGPDGKPAALAAESGKPYGGSYGAATIDIYAQTEGNPGIRAALIAVQFLKDGDAFGGSRPDASDFDVVEGADADDIA